MDNINANSTNEQVESNQEENKINAGDVALTYDSSIVFRRWGSTVIDISFFLVLFSLSVFISYISTSSVLHSVLQYLPLISLIIIIIPYYIFLEGLTGYTLGKYILKIRVVNKNFNPPGILKAIIRTLLRLIEINPFLIGGLPAFIAAIASKTKQRLGDMAAGTYVLRKKDIPIQKS